MEDGGASSTCSAGIATILFDRKATRNAMLQATWRALPDLVAQAEADSRVAAIMIRGANGHFGAGNDIVELGRVRHEPAKCRAYGSAMAEAMACVEQATKPIVAVIEGSCYGASVALALAADYRIAAHDARFAITPAKLGALYLRSDLHRLVAAVGPGQTRRMIYTADVLTATAAAAIGLVEQVVPVAHLDAEVARTAHALSAGSPYTLHNSKQMLRGAGLGDAPIEDEESLSRFVAAMQGADFEEGYTAFMEKRIPIFPRR